MRGVIRNREYSNQVKDYSGLCFGKITPTDIDGVIEYKNLGYIIIELKHNGAPLPYGQQLCLERLCDDLERTKPTLLVIASHDCDGDINVANLLVTKFRSEHQTRLPDARITVRLLCAQFILNLENPRSKLWHNS